MLENEVLYDLKARDFNKNAKVIESKLAAIQKLDAENKCMKILSELSQMNQKRIMQK